MIPSCIQTIDSWLPFTSYMGLPSYGGGKKQQKGIPMPKKNMGWVVYGKKNCSFCVNACSWFELNQISYRYYDIDKFISEKRIQNINEVYEYLGKKRIKNHKTVPLIFYNGVFIGGYTDLLVWMKQHK